MTKDETEKHRMHRILILFNRVKLLINKAVKRYYDSSIIFKNVHKFLYLWIMHYTQK